MLTTVNRPLLKWVKAEKKRIRFGPKEQPQHCSTEWSTFRRAASSDPHATWGSMLRQSPAFTEDVTALSLLSHMPAKDRQHAVYPREHLTDVAGNPDISYQKDLTTRRMSSTSLSNQQALINETMDTRRNQGFNSQEAAGPDYILGCVC